MLQRAASNACSWWWASHIRTKQSKWLEQSMQDMEEKVQSMLKLIEEDGDSFAKRAEMYYKRRPELISSVEDTYRTFKALADRYDLLSKELQNANRTIATVFPEQVQFPMDEDDDCQSLTPKFPKKSPANVPKVPNAPIENLKGLLNTASKQLQTKKPVSKLKNKNKTVAKSGLSKEEALEEIDKVHKEILGLQTFKEFVKSSYESGLAKYWDIENKIMELQDKVYKLQDEYDVEVVIEDGEARTLMAEAALKSCEETLAALQKKQEQSKREAKEEFKKIESAREILKTFKRDYMKEETDDEDGDEGWRDNDEEVNGLIEELKELDLLQKKAEIKLDSSSVGSLTVTELAEKIDELVNKVISLETAVSSQTVLINTLRTEVNELHAQIKSLEDEKESLIGDTNSLSKRVKEMEDKLNRIMSLNKNVESQNSNLETNFAEARSSLDNLSEKLSSVKPDEEVEEADSSKLSSVKPDEEVEETGSSLSENKAQKEIKDDETEDESKSRKKSKKKKKSKEEEKDHVSIPDEKEEEKEEVIKEVDVSVEHSEDQAATFSDKKAKEDVPDLDHRNDDEGVKTDEAQGVETEKESELSWQQMLLSGTEDREKILLKEYTTILRNYKDVKKKLSDTEKKERDIQFDITLQMRELKQAILKRDQEILHLRQQLSQLMQGNTTTTTTTDQDQGGTGGSLPSNNNSSSSLQESDNIDQSSVKINEKEEGSMVVDNDGPVVGDAEKEVDLKLIFIDRSPPVSVVEEKLRLELDAILDENLDFWLRFSTAFHQVQKFKSEVEDLEDEISKLKERKKQEGSMTSQIKSEVRPIYKHLREIQTELTMWLEQSVRLKEELKRRFSSLCSIQEEITTALKEGVEEEEIKFSSHQAAKLQGEILNMKQENNKVREELQACLDHISVLQVDVEKTLRKLNAEFGISNDQPQLQHSMSRSRVPLRSFIFGIKDKNKKHSLFSFMHPNRKYHVVRPLPPSSTSHH